MAKRYKNIPVTINYDDQTLASTHSSTQIPSGNIAISDNGLNFMLAFDRYKGHQYWNGEKYVMGYNYSGNAFPNGITETNAYRLWLADITKAQNDLRKRLNNNPLFFLQHQWDALVSFFYNTGSIDHTEIEGYEFDFLYFLQNGTKDDIASLLQTDNRSPTRRTAEASLFRLGNYGNIKSRIWLRNEGIQYIRQNYLKLEDKDGNINKKAQQQAQYSYYLETGKFIKEISEIDRRRIIALIEQDADTSIDTSTPVEQYIVKTTTDAEYSAISTTATATTTPALTVIDYSASAVGASATTQTTTGTTTATTTTTAHTHQISDWLPTGGLAGQFLSSPGTWAFPSGTALTVEEIYDASNISVGFVNTIQFNTNMGFDVSSGGAGKAIVTQRLVSYNKSGLVPAPAPTDGVKFLRGDASWQAITINYNDITGTPSLAPVATSGSYNDLLNNPVLFSGSYTNLTNKPGNFTGATSGGVGGYGFVPAPPATAQTKFLKGSGTWAVPVDTTYGNFTGTDGTNSGTAGLVIAPTSADGLKFLKGDGTWATVSGGGGGNAIEVVDETTSLTSSLVKLTFTGAGVTATGSNSITVTIPGGGGGIALSDLSASNASPSGAGALAYDNTNGVFQYTPPSLSGYSTTGHTHTFASITSTPTSIAGYGITDANEFDDISITLGNVTTPTNDTADGGGIILKAAADKTIAWDKTLDAWQFNTSVEVAGLVRIVTESSTPTAPADTKGGILYAKVVDSNARPMWIAHGVAEEDIGRPAVMTGPTGQVGGTSGLVPAPGATDGAKYLRGDGNWMPASGGTSAWTVTGSDIYYNAGKVGIGITDPDTELEVKGTIHISKEYTTTNAPTAPANGDGGIIFFKGGTLYFLTDGAADQDLTLDTTYTTVSASADGLAPQLPGTLGGKFLKGDGNWEAPPDTTYSAVSTSAAGLAPTLPTSPGGKFLKDDGNWEVPAYITDLDHDALTNFVGDEHIDWTTTNTKNIHTGNYTNTTYSNFTGDTGTGPGGSGLVPAPAAGDTVASKFLKANATWETIEVNDFQSSVSYPEYRWDFTAGTDIAGTITRIGVSDASSAPTFGTITAFPADIENAGNLYATQVGLTDRDAVYLDIFHEDDSSISGSTFNFRFRIDTVTDPDPFSSAVNNILVWQSTGTTGNPSQGRVILYKDYGTNNPVVIVDSLDGFTNHTGELIVSTDTLNAVDYANYAWHGNNTNLLVDGSTYTLLMQTSPSYRQENFTSTAGILPATINSTEIEYFMKGTGDWTPIRSQNIVRVNDDESNSGNLGFNPASVGGQEALWLQRGQTYKFDLSDIQYSTPYFRFSTFPEGEHAVRLKLDNYLISTPFESETIYQGTSAQYTAGTATTGKLVGHINEYVWVVDITNGTFGINQAVTATSGTQSNNVTEVISGTELLSGSDVTITKSGTPGDRFSYVELRINPTCTLDKFYYYGSLPDNGGLIMISKTHYEALNIDKDGNLILGSYSSIFNTDGYGKDYIDSNAILSIDQTDVASKPAIYVTSKRTNTSTNPLVFLENLETTFDQACLYIDHGASKAVGGNVPSNPTSVAIDVKGIVQADQFKGDGSGLTGLLTVLPEGQIDILNDGTKSQLALYIDAADSASQYLKARPSSTLPANTTLGWSDVFTGEVENGFPYIYDSAWGDTGGSGTWVIVGYAGFTIGPMGKYSTDDGVTWTDISFSITPATGSSVPSYFLVSVTWSEYHSMFAAVGHDLGTSNPGGLILTSTDGITWTQQTYPSWWEVNSSISPQPYTIPYKAEQIKAGGDTFIIVTESNGSSSAPSYDGTGWVITSTNGTSWTNQGSYLPSDYGYNPDGSGTGAGSWGSLKGSDTYTVDLKGIGYGNGLWVIGGDMMSASGDASSYPASSFYLGKAGTVLWTTNPAGGFTKNQWTEGNNQFWLDTATWISGTGASFQVGPNYDATHSINMEFRDFVYNPKDGKWYGSGWASIDVTNGSSTTHNCIASINDPSSGTENWKTELSSTYASSNTNPNFYGIAVTDKELIAVGESNNPGGIVGAGDAIVWKRSAFSGGAWAVDTSSTFSNADRLFSVTAGGPNNNTVITCGTHGALFRYYSFDAEMTMPMGKGGTGQSLISEDNEGRLKWEFPVARSFTGGTTTGIAVGSSEKIRVLANGYTGFGVINATKPIEHSNGAYLSTAGVWADASDKMRKFEIGEIGYGLPEVLQLIPKRYKLIDGSFDIGFIAQEIENIIPEVVSGIDAYTDNEGALVGGKGIAYGHIAAVLVKAVQQLSDKNNELEEKIKRLEEWQSLN